MNNFFLILGALVFLLLIWGVAYRNILGHFLREVKKNKSGVEELFLSLHGKLPYLFEVLKEHKAYGEGSKKMFEARQKLAEKGSMEEKFKLYEEIYGMLEKLFSGGGKNLKSDSGYLEVRQELKDLHDDMRLLIKEYNQHVGEYNARLIKFPGNIVGSVCRMRSLNEL